MFVILFLCCCVNKNKIIRKVKQTVTNMNNILKDKAHRYEDMTTRII
jgi:hypothetical protein